MGVVLGCDARDEAADSGLGDGDGRLKRREERELVREIREWGGEIRV